MYVYKKERHDFSRSMSRAAFKKIYVPVLGAVSIERMDTEPGGPTDPDLRGTDVVLTLRSGRRVTVAERFRTAEYIKYDDVTIREVSMATGRKLEIVGLNAQYMLYAVVNQTLEDFTEDESRIEFLRWDLLYAPLLLEVAERVARDERYRHFNKNGSSGFVSVPRSFLFAAGAVAATSEQRRVRGNVVPFRGNF